MKKLFLLLCLALAAASCGSGADKTNADTPAYNPYVDAFTSGRVPRTTPVYLIFSQEVDSLNRTAGLLDRSLSLKPSVSGSWAWEDSRTVVFRPAGEFKRDTEYTVTADISAFFGGVEGADRRFTFGFRTLPLVLRASPAEIAADAEEDEKYDITVEIASADAESPETVERMVSISENATAQWTHASGGTSHTLLFENVAAGADPRNIVISSGKEELTTVYIPAKTEFGVYDATYSAWPEKYIEVTFTKSLDETQNLHGLAYIVGNSSETVTVDGNKLRLYPDNNKVGKVEVFLSRNIRSAKGLILGEETTREVSVSGAEPGLRFVGNGVIIPRSAELSVPFEAVWLRGVKVSVVRIYENRAGQFLQDNNLDGGYELSRVGRLMAHKTIWLDENGDADLSTWKTYAVDLRKLIEPEPGAIYRIELDMNQDLSAYPCDGADPKKTKEQVAADDEGACRSRMAMFDRGGYYYDYENIDWRRYNYRERENPCAYSFYVEKKISRNVLATDLGLIVKSEQTGAMTALVHNLLTAAPVSGVRVEAFNYQGQPVASAVTSAEGMATLTPAGIAKAYYVVASQGTQRTYMRVDAGMELSTSSFDVSGESVQRGIKGFIYGDRGVWRPGDVIYLSFMLGDPAKTLPPNVPVVMELYDPMGQLYSRKTQTEGELGLYTFEMPTEPDARTGAWNVKVEAGGASFSKRIRIEAIKPNRLKIDFGFNGQKTILAGKSTAEGKLHVEWLTGAVARSLRFETDVTVRAVATRFTGFDRYVFDDPSKKFDGRDVRIADSRVDDKGDATVTMRIDTGSSAPGMLAANLTTRVYEESGDFSVDGFVVGYSPYERYVGVQSPQTDYNQLATGRDHRFGVAMVDYEGKPLAGKTVKVDIYKVEWHWWWDSYGSNLANYMSRSYNSQRQKLEVTTGTDGRAGFTMNMPDDEWGTYYIKVSDAAGSHTAGLMAYFDWPDSWRRGSENGDAATELRFTTDKDTYAPGEVMTITLPSSQGARAVVSIENGTRVLSVASHPCRADETTIQIPVTADMQPNVYVSVSLLQPHGATLNDVPIRLYGIVPVTVTSPDSRLAPVIKAPAEIKPEAKYEITVSEQNGRRIAYTLAIVDEGLLDLTRFATPDPWSAFNAREALGVSTFDMYNHVLGAYGGRIEQLFSIGGDDEAGGGDKNTVNRFKPVVRFDGPFVLKKGESRKHTYTMDNYNGRVRVMVVAGDGAAYGNAQQTVMVRKPVMLLGTLPRVIGTGEEMDVPATVFATEDWVGDVNVTIACSEGMTVVGESKKTVNFRTTGDKTVTFRVRTSKKAGAGRVTITASGKGDKSTYETDIEIRSVRRPQVKVTPATLEAGKTWNADIPLPGADGTNSIALEVSGIPPLNLTSRLSYLLGYPHGCLEQITSKAFPQLYVGSFATLTGKQKIDSEAAIAETIRRYKSYQTAEGVFSYWPGGTSINAWTSAYAMHFLLEAEARGHLVPAALRRTVLANLRLVARNWKQPSAGNYYVRSEQLTQAYRLYVLALAGGAETGAMNRLREESSLTTGARWMLAAAYAQSGRKDVAGQLVAATVPMSDAYNPEYDITYGSPLRDRAVKLMVLTMLDRAAEAAVLCREISAELSSDGWFSTQSTAYALMAVSRYAEKYAMAGRMRFGYDVAGSDNNINSEKSVWTETLAEKAAGGTIPAKVSNTGDGALFVRLITEGTPDEGNEQAYANNIALDVKYDGAADVSSLEKGTAVTSVVTVRNPTSKIVRNLVLTQIFPSGWEILSTRYMNDDIFTGGNDSAGSGISYQDIRDDRVYTYIDYLPAGHSVTVKLNLAATYGGVFYLPPVWCEAMYDNLTRANTEGSQVEVR